MDLQDSLAHHRSAVCVQTGMLESEKEMNGTTRLLTLNEERGSKGGEDQWREGVWRDKSRGMGKSTLKGDDWKLRFYPLKHIPVLSSASPPLYRSSFISSSSCFLFLSFTPVSLTYTAPPSFSLSVTLPLCLLSSISCLSVCLYIPLHHSSSPSLLQ